MFQKQHSLSEIASVSVLRWKGAPERFAHRAFACEQKQELLCKLFRIVTVLKCFTEGIVDSQLLYWYDIYCNQSGQLLFMLKFLLCISVMSDRRYFLNMSLSECHTNVL
jgi:hypothetical protein